MPGDVLGASHVFISFLMAVIVIKKVGSTV